MREFTLFNFANHRHTDYIEILQNQNWLIIDLMTNPYSSPPCIIWIFPPAMAPTKIHIDPHAACTPNTVPHRFGSISHSVARSKNRLWVLVVVASAPKRSIARTCDRTNCKTVRMNDPIMAPGTLSNEIIANGVLHGSRKLATSHRPASLC